MKRVDKLVFDKIIEWSITGAYLDIEFDSLITLHDTIAGILGYDKIGKSTITNSISSSCTLSDTQLVRVHVMLCRVEIVLNEWRLARGTISRLKDWITNRGLGEETGALCTVVTLRAELLAAESGGNDSSGSSSEYLDGATRAVVDAANRAAVIGNGGGGGGARVDLFEREDLAWAVGEREGLGLGRPGERPADAAGLASRAVAYAERGQLREAVWETGRAVACAGGAVPALWALRGQLCVLVARAERERERGGGKAGGKAGGKVWARAAVGSSRRAVLLGAEGAVGERARATLAEGMALLHE